MRPNDSHLLSQFHYLVMKCPMDRKSAFDQNCISAVMHPFGSFRMYQAYHLPFLRKYPEWYSGSSRVAYMDREKGVTYKVPLNGRGLRDNERDARLYAEQVAGKGDKSQPIAECYLKEGFILEMEICVPIFDHSEIPSHLRSRDGFQVGYNKEGKVVFFDL